jgi:ferredoxin
MPNSDPKTITTKDGKTLEIKVDRSLCIGAATCVVLAPNTFELDNENKAVIKDTAGEEEYQKIIEAAKGCPVLAVIVKDENGKQIFP